MELKEGMYLRHSGLEGEYPIIQKIIKLETPGRCGGKYKVYTDKCEDWFIDSDYIEIEKSKASYNPIDIIEVGDYVNGLKVIEVREHLHGDIEIVLTNGEFRWSFSKNESDYEIKTIATKEQFEQIQYRIGD